MKYGDWIIGYVKVVDEVHVPDTSLVETEIPSLCEMQDLVDQHSIHPSYNLMHALYADADYAKEIV